MTSVHWQRAVCIRAPPAWLAPGESPPCPHHSHCAQPCTEAVSVPGDSVLSAAQGEDPPGCDRAQSHPWSWRLELTHTLMRKKKEGVCLCPGQVAQPCPESQRSRREGTSESHPTFSDHRLPPRARLRACTQSQGTTTGVWPCPLLWGQRPCWLPPPTVWHFLLAEPCQLLPSLPLSDQSDETTRTAPPSSPVLQEAVP